MQEEIKDIRERKERGELLTQKELAILSMEEAPSKENAFSDVEKRVKPFVDYLIKFVKKNKVNVAISGHGNSIRLFRKIMERKSANECVKWVIPYDRYFEYKI